MVDNVTKRIIDRDLKICEFLYKNILDINICETDDEYFKELENMANKNELENVLLGMHARYSSIISDFPEDYDIYNTLIDEEIAMKEYANYLKNVFEKLSAFQRMGYEENKSGNTTIIHNNNNNNSTSTNTSTNLNTLFNHVQSFQELKNKIENMSTLTDSQIDEILEKIETLEKAINTNTRKSKKWENAKESIKWFLDKGFDIAKVIIPFVFESIDKS